jgi:hypothetical protein
MDLKSMCLYWKSFVCENTCSMQQSHYAPCLSLVIQQQKETIKYATAWSEEAVAIKPTSIAAGVSTSNIASVNGL